MKDYVFLAILIVGWQLINIYFNDMDHKEIMNALEEQRTEFDYSLELRTGKDGCGFIEVRRDSCLFIVHPDSLEEFIIKDNL